VDIINDITELSFLLIIEGDKKLVLEIHPY